MPASDTAIFDMDGTLVDTMKMTARAFHDLAASFGLAPLPEARIREAIGLSDEFFYRALYPDGERATLRAFGRAVEARENEYARALGPGVLFPGVRAMLEGLAAAGFRLFIASTGSERHVSAALAAGGILDMFERIECGQADKGPMAVRLTAGLDPARCFLAGDTGMDASAARRAGVRAYGAAFGYLKPLDYPLFDRVFDTPGALLAEAAGAAIRRARDEGPQTKG